MDFVSEAIVLQARKHGETSAIMENFTRERGRHNGLVRGGAGRRMRPLLQPGNIVEVEWRGRLEDHLGYFTVEIVDALAGLFMEDRLSLAALNAIAALLREMLPEKQPLPDLYDVTKIVLERLDDQAVWPALYVRWESLLLQSLGYGLDLSRCAGTGVTDNLTHVSPRSGRAVSTDAAQPYLDKLFRLPPFLRGEPIASPQDIADGLRLTGHFLETRVQWERNRTLPDARRVMVARLQATGLAAD
ncbi:DNA repair protein RecO [Algimonas porphyrae]|uniref:DNA repair protein RecO n=1 Tax=Algimonas porphyrae TaxID=1128113 RepID=A0ABQ5V057_9PROT|nr:DNA repair protein RecO [Algimonas porphyrae]GLQ20054.1 DNA repair protein RecO [Algimonas porphyrae]